MFGPKSRSYLLTYRAAGQPQVVTQLVTTPDRGSLMTYTPERCGVYHGDQVRGQRAVDLGFGQTGFLVDTVENVPASGGDGQRQLRFNVLYWYVPFAVDGHPSTARFTLIMDSDQERRVSANGEAGLAPGGRDFDRIDSWLVDFGRTLVKGTVALNQAA